MARKLMRSMRSTAMSTGRIGEELGLDRVQASDVVAALVADGYIEPEKEALSRWRSEDDGDTVKFWEPTIGGIALSKARIGKGIPRAKAERILQAFLDRVRDANADPEELFWVERVELYGSLADPGSRAVGDVDLRVVLSERLTMREHKRRCEEVTKAAESEGRSFSTLIGRMAWPQLRLERRLRRGSALLDVQFDLDRGLRDLPDGAIVVEVYRRN